MSKCFDPYYNGVKLYFESDLKLSTNSQKFAYVSTFMYVYRKKLRYKISKRLISKNVYSVNKTYT